MSEVKQRGEPGWKVVDPDGKFVGTVEHVRDDHLIVAQGRIIQHTLYIPFDHLGGAANGQVTVTVPAKEADAQGWRFPPNAGFSHGASDDGPVAGTLRTAGMSSSALAESGLSGAMHDGKVDPEQLDDLSSDEDETK